MMYGLLMMINLCYMMKLIDVGLLLVLLKLNLLEYMKKLFSKIITCLLYLVLGVVASLLSLGLFLSYLEGDMSRGLLEVLK